MPNVDILGPVRVKTREFLLDKITPTICERFLNYLGLVRLGLAVVVGPCPLAHNSDPVEIMALMYIYNPNIGKVYCSGPTHHAVEVFADKVHKVSREVVKPLAESTPVVVCGRSLETEMKAFINHIGRKHLEMDNDRATRFSPCEWLLKIIKFNDFHLLESDSHAMWEFRRVFKGEGKYAALRDFVKNKEAKINSSVRSQIKELLGKIIMEADILCTDPATSGDEKYSEYNKDKAKAVVFVHADSMLQADALLVWGTGCRPCLMRGILPKPEHRPCVAMHKETRNHQPINRFSNLARISELERVKRSGWPCFFTHPKAPLPRSSPPVKTQRPELGFKNVKH